MVLQQNPSGKIDRSPVSDYRLQNEVWLLSTPLSQVQVTYKPHTAPTHQYDHFALHITLSCQHLSPAFLVENVYQIQGLFQDCLQIFKDF